LFCPKCRYEYGEGVLVCPDCGEELVPVLPETDREYRPVEEGEDGNWVEIGRLTSQQYAEMVLEALRAKDIPAVILSGAGYFGQAGQMGISSYLPAGGAYTIVVPRAYVSDADSEALEILGDDWRKARLIRGNSD